MARYAGLGWWKCSILAMAAVVWGGAGLAGAPTVTRVAGAAAATPAASPVASSAAETIAIVGLVTHPGPISVSELQTLPTETVKVDFESGGSPEAQTYTGVRLTDVLAHVGVAGDPATHNPLLRRYLIVTAKDGYQIVVSGGELDPNFGNVPMLLAWEQDDAPLSPEDGPVRLVVPGDLKGGRYIYGIVSIDVRSIDEGAS
jgi:DMSO/TMAO reductase YedYZ molybdopterin-dependent catalytic subunit